MKAFMLAAMLTLGAPLRGAEVLPGANGVEAIVAASDTNPPPTFKKPKKEEPVYIKLFGMTIGIIAIVMGCGIPLLAIWTDYAKQRDAMTNWHKERMAALEKGLEAPPFPREFLSDEARAFEWATTGMTTGQAAGYRARCGGSGLTSGLVWIGIGAGTIILLHYQNIRGMHPAWSAIPFAIGVAYLLGYLLEGRAREKALRSQSPPRTN